MRNYIKYIGILALGMVACEPEFDNPVDEQDAYSNGEADFSNYVALGNSLTAGYADNALYITGQQNSYPNILAQQFAKVQETQEFRIPYMADNAGGLLAGDQQITSNRLVLETLFNEEGEPVQTPKVYTGMAPTTNVLNKLTGPFNNMGVPGARSYHLLAPGYGNPAGLMADPATANPYFVRFASSPEASVLEDAVAQQPTFFSLWIGNNDVLGYATTGGLNEASITDPAMFTGAYTQLVNGLVQSGAEEGVLINIPDVTDVPFFTTIPNNALVLSAEQAANLTGFFQAVAGIFTQVLMQQQVPQEQAAQIASQYALTFSEGPNRFVIDVPETQTNPLGFRQMTEEELLLFTIDRTAIPTQGYGSAAVGPEVMQVLGILQQGGQPTPEQAQLVLEAVNGIDDKDALDIQEIQNIRNATAKYNETILALAQANGLAHVDAAALLNKVATTGISFDEGTVTSTFGSGGAFSLDGIHLTPRGYALVANKIIEEINKTYNSEVPTVNIGNYGTVTPSNDVGN
ncbi:SGNH/GDSL hydrolase family protein [Salinimicrobium sp. MT39]|uniref:SGNH/GDSL hydrolase family protein n=1 Tax=Salinimicrobium profundisediminis TaxID=2994553 RepID=A0A9X3CXD0_9FLAO|nr:SGNH/GDSL hydrolase family protein [Salinimicrobium profundisediminis]MCX2837234.1 SGNH/GDSL hydrolase family protein [Salinimicrobium profundisediminis]